jgi:hypothetical protein
MITDINFLLASAQTATSSIAASNVANLKNIFDAGAGQDIYAVVTVTTAFTGGGTIQFQVKASADDTIVTGDETIGSSAVITADATNLPVGRIIVIRINESTARDSRVPDTGVITNGGRQYLGMWYATTGTVSTGAVNVSIVLDPQTMPKSYNSGFRLNKSGGTLGNDA